MPLHSRAKGRRESPDVLQVVILGDRCRRERVGEAAVTLAHRRQVTDGRNREIAASIRNTGLQVRSATCDLRGYPTAALIVVQTKSTASQLLP